MRTWIVIGLFLPWFCFSQDRGSDYQRDSVRALQTQYKLYKIYYQRPDSIAYYVDLNLKTSYTQFAHCIHDSLDAAMYAEALFQKGYYEFWNMKNEDTATYYLKKTLEVCNAYLGNEHVTATMAMNKLAFVHLRRGEYDKAGDMLYKSLKIREKTLSNLDILLAYGYGNWSYYNELIGQYHTAKIYADKSSKIGEEQYELFSKRNRDAYNKLVSLAGYDPQVTSDDLKNLIIRDVPFSYAGDLTSRCYDALNSRNVLLAKSYYDKLVKVNEDYPVPFVKDHLTRLKMQFELIENPESQQVKDYYQQILKEDPIYGQKRPESGWYNYWTLLFKMGKYSEAVRLFERSYDYFNDQQGKSLYIGAYFSAFYLIRTLNKLGDYKNADSLSHSFISRLVGPENFNKLSQGKEVLDQPMAFLQRSLHILAAHGETSLYKFKKDHNLTDLERAFQLYSAFDKQIQKLRQQMDRMDDRAEFLEHNYWIYEDAIETALLLFESKGENKYREYAIEWSSHCKSSMNHFINKSDGMEEFKDSLQLKIQNLGSKIEHLELKIKEIGVARNTQDENSINNLRNLVVEYRTEYDYLKSKSSYLASHFSKLYEPSVVNYEDIIKEVQRRNTNYLDFFVGSHYLFGFFISRDTTVCMTLKIDPDFNNTLNSFVNELNTIPLVVDSKTIMDYQTKAYQLFKYLMEWFWPYMTGTNLFLSTDGQLLYLPFESLVSQTYSSVASFKDIKFLLYDKNIFYGYGAADFIIQDKDARKLMPIKYIGFAPRFYSNWTSVEENNQDLTDRLFLNSFRAALGPLKYNVDEIKESSEIFTQSEYYLNLDNVNGFSNIIRDKDIVHLATHALIDDTYPEYSQILLGADEDKQQYNALYAYRLAQMDIKSNLFILNACNTNRGKLKKGEGLLSLALSVKMAGVKNLISSLWNINDFSTKLITVEFLKNIDKGLNKALALRKAKINYLNSLTSPVGGHPYYWASLILIGDEQPMTYNIWIKTLFIFITVISLSFLILILKRL